VRFLKVIDQLDSPSILDAAVTAIPGSGSSPLQVVASLAKTSYALLVHESLGELVGVYKGPVGQEVLECVIGLGPDEVAVSLHKGARISLRSMKVAAIATGDLCIQFLGDT
jgi:hypothetical protein